MKTLRQAFDEGLNELSDMLMEMVDAVIDVYDDMFTAIRTQDLEKARKIIENDTKINALETSINEMGNLLILKQCPVARDLRTIITTIKIANELERLGDYASNNALYILKTAHDNETFRSYFLSYVEPLSKMFFTMKEAIDKESMEAAGKVCDLDSEVDEIYQKQIMKFIDIAGKNEGITAVEAARAMLVIKQFERAGDHLTNIGEEVIYLAKGERLTLN
jgi:phosphate transport system protein